MLQDDSGTKINSVSLTTMGLVLAGPISVGEAKASTSLVNVPGMDGSLDLTLRNEAESAYFNRRTISVPLAAVGTRAEVAEAKATVGAYAGKDVYLYDAVNGGEWHGTLTIGPWSDRAESWSGQFASTATAKVAAEPALLVPARTVSITAPANPANPFVYFVDGNRPSWPTFTLVPDRTSTSIGVAVATSSGTATGSVTYEFESPQTHDFVIDCFMGVATSNGVVQAPQLFADFPVLLPGSTNIWLTGCTSATMVYRPRVMV